MLTPIALRRLQNGNAFLKLVGLAVNRRFNQFRTPHIFSRSSAKYLVDRFLIMSVTSVRRIEPCQWQSTYRRCARFFGWQSRNCVPKTARFCSDSVKFTILRNSCRSVEPETLAIAGPKPDTGNQLVKSETEEGLIRVLSPRKKRERVTVKILEEQPR